MCVTEVTCDGLEPGAHAIMLWRHHNGIHRVPIRIPVWRVERRWRLLQTNIDHHVEVIREPIELINLQSNYTIIIAIYCSVLYTAD